MPPHLDKVFGYKGNALQLPVPDLASAIPFYEQVLGFHVQARSHEPFPSAVLVRDRVTIGLVENGGDPTQDGCAFHVQAIDALFAEFKTNGLQMDDPGFGVEQRNGVAWRVFFVVAPDGLCFWFGEAQSS